MKKPHIDYPINDDTLYRLADLFKVFGDPTRIRILYALSVEELCVQDIASASCAEADVTGQISKRWKNNLLLPGRQPRGNHHESGSGTRNRRIKHKKHQKPIRFPAMEIADRLFYK